MVQVNGTPVEYHEGMTVQDLVEFLRETEEFKQFFLYNTHAVIIKDAFVDRENYETTPVEDGADIILRAMPLGG